MADLDDFFAKKDRKKSKGKKFTTTEEIAKKLEETGKRSERSKPKEKISNPEGGDDNQQVEDEDEWREFEEEKKDYTGLKIGNLTVNESTDQDSDDDRGTGENSSDGESGEAGSKHSGPWKKTDQAKEEPPAPAPQQPQTVSAASTNTGGSYKAPHLRNARPMPNRSHRSTAAPDINSEEYFPTLNSKQPSANDSNPWGRRRKDEGTFEEVRNRGGNRYVMSDTQTQGPKLSLGNKYGALSQDQS